MIVKLFLTQPVLENNLAILRLLEVFKSFNTSIFFTEVLVNEKAVNYLFFLISDFSHLTGVLKIDTLNKSITELLIELN